MEFNRELEEKFSREAVDVIKAYIPRFVQIWKELGFAPNKVEERYKTAVSHHKELWESMLDEEHSNRKRIIATIDRLGRQHHQLCKELGIPYRAPGEHLPLLELENELQETITALNKEKEERMKSVRIMFSEEEELCERLGEDLCELNRDKIPTTEQVTMLETRIKKLRTEIVTRQSQYLTLRDSIRTLLQELEMSARSGYERDLLVGEPSEVSLTEKDMNKIRELHHGLNMRLERNKKKATELMNKIQTLWDRLGVEAEARDMFLVQNRGSAPSTIASLEEELSRLEELKRQNIERFIKAVREDLKQWWERCFVSEAERQNFTVFFLDVFSEDVLNLHEAEVEKYKSLYNNNKDIFAKVQHRENLWKRMEDIEAKSRDPSRLFGNRGCSLLQEEKERKKIMKELPRVEEQLNELLSNYERSQGHILRIHGQDYRQYVTEQWILYTEQKENEKAQRQKDRAEKLVEEAKGGAKPTTPMKRRLGTTNTGLRTHLESPKAKQRKLLAPSTAPQQRPGRKILTEAMVNQLHPTHSSNDHHDMSVMSTYSAFTATLKNKASQCVNSTVLMDNNPSTPTTSRGTVQASTLPRRRSPRLASLTPSTPISHSMLRRSRTQASMAPPLSTVRLTPSRSTPKLTMTKHPRPFLV